MFGRRDGRGCTQAFDGETRKRIKQQWKSGTDQHRAERSDETPAEQRWRQMPLANPEWDKDRDSPWRNHQKNGRSEDGGWAFHNPKNIPLLLLLCYIRSSV